MGFNPVQAGFLFITLMPLSEQIKRRRKKWVSIPSKRDFCLLHHHQRDRNSHQYFRDIVEFQSRPSGIFVYYQAGYDMDITQWAVITSSYLQFQSRPSGIFVYYYSMRHLHSDMTDYSVSIPSKRDFCLLQTAKAGRGEETIIEASFNPVQAGFLFITHLNFTGLAELVGKCFNPVQAGFLFITYRYKIPQG